MPHYGTITTLDYSEEKSNLSVHFGAITAASIGGFLTQWGNFRNALGALLLGTIAQEKLVMDSTVLSNTPPASANAQNELKIQFNYEGVTSRKKFRFEAGTADPTAVIPGTDQYDLTDPEVAAAITAFETLGRSPDSDQEGVNVLDVRLVGRNV